jgi:dodecin
MPDHVYKVEEIVGSSENGVKMLLRARSRRLGRQYEISPGSKVIETRGHIEDGEVAHYQVKVKVGFTLDE